jgi:hypothetical protein
MLLIAIKNIGKHMESKNTMKAVLAILMGATVLGLLGGCNTNSKEVVMATKDFDLKGFAKIEVGGAFEVDIVRSDSFKVSVTADDFPHIRVEKVGDTLVIRRQGVEWFAPFHNRPKATVTLPELSDLNISGASQGKFENFQSDADLTVILSGASHIEVGNISAGKIELKVTGASSLIGDIKAVKDAKFEATGASRIELTGTACNAIARVSGASKVELSKFSVQNANLEVSGASNAVINLNGRLDANISGASSLLWSGTPIMGDIQTSGASNLRRK